MKTSTGPLGLERRLRRAGAWVAPHGLMARHHQRQEAERKRQEAERSAAAVDQAQADRRRLLRRLPLPTEAVVPFDYETAVAFLVESGLSENQVGAGSIPQASLDFVSGTRRQP